MLFRFSLYGFLKNQRYFEPFLVLVFLDRGLSFFLIGLLVAFREVVVNLLEIPSGAVADACGRRGSMILSFAAYILSFTVFGLAGHAALLFPAMALYAVGDAFRTGTHKAMIFEWLRLQDRLGERTRVYGYTRSWSKLGSAVSALAAAAFVFLSDGYDHVFFFAAVPYVLAIVNFLGYPRELDGAHEKVRSPGEVARHLRQTLGDAFGRRPLRRLVFESMGFEGVFGAVKDYLQPVLQVLANAVLAAAALAAGLPAIGELTDVQRTALAVGLVYFVLHLLSAVASRRAHRLSDLAGGDDRAAPWLWVVGTAVYTVLGLAAWRGWTLAVVLAFVALHVLQNVWRPILISRFNDRSRAEEGATVLSIESQSKRAATMVAAPVLGWAVDQLSAGAAGGTAAFWPLGAFGAAVAFFFVGRVVAAQRRPS